MMCDRCQVSLVEVEYHLASTGFHDNNIKLFNLCVNCYAIHLASTKWIYKYENNNLIAQLARARKHKLPASLTPRQWYQTKAYFNHRCAYCQIAKVDCLEHFIPIVLGGGTVWSNCVPSCTFCNQRKGDIHPALVTAIPQKDIERVRKYLLSLLPNEIP